MHHKSVICLLETSMSLSFRCLVSSWKVEWWNHCMKCMKVATKEIDASDYKEFFQTCVQPFEDKPDVKCTFTIISYKLDFFCTSLYVDV